MIHKTLRDEQIMGIIIALNGLFSYLSESLMIDLGGFDWVGDFRLYQKVCLVIQDQLDVGSTADDLRNPSRIVGVERRKVS